MACRPAPLPVTRRTGRAPSLWLLRAAERGIFDDSPCFSPCYQGAQPSETGSVGLRPPPYSTGKPGRFPGRQKPSQFRSALREPQNARAPDGRLERTRISSTSTASAIRAARRNFLFASLQANSSSQIRRSAPASASPSRGPGNGILWADEACRGLRTEFRPFSRILRLKSPASLDPLRLARATRRSHGASSTRWRIMSIGMRDWAHGF